MRFLAPLLCLLVPVLALADETACRSAPARDCLLKIATDRANAEDVLREAVGDLLSLAATQERVGSDRAPDTLALLLARLDDVPNAADRVELVNWSLIGGELAGAPVLATDLLIAVRAYGGGDPLTLAKVEGQLLAYSGQIEALRAAVQAAEPGLREDAALAGATALLSMGDSASAYGLTDLVGSPSFRSSLDETAVILLLRKDKVDAAESVASMSMDPAVRAENLVRVARALVGKGERSKARALLDAAAWNGEGAVFLPAARADVLARLGDPGAALSELDRMPEGLVQPRRRTDVVAVAALVSGDLAGFLATLAETERPSEAGFRAKDAVLALLASGQDAEPVLAAVSPEVLPYGLNALGLHQARQGDLEKAHATLRRLQELGPEGRVHGDFRSELARAELASGDVAEAARLALEGDLRLVAEIAGRMPD